MNIETENPILVECSWEVCNQLGGIYTVIRSKAPCMTQKWGDRYCLVGPYLHSKIPAEFEPSSDYNDPFGRAVLEMKSMGFEIYYGYWLVSGKPKVVLINFDNLYGQTLSNRKFLLWEKCLMTIG